MRSHWEDEQYSEDLANEPPTSPPATEQGHSGTSTHRHNYRPAKVAYRARTKQGDKMGGDLSLEDLAQIAWEKDHHLFNEADWSTDPTDWCSRCNKTTGWDKEECLEDCGKVWGFD